MNWKINMAYLDIKGAMRNYLIDLGYEVYQVVDYQELTKNTGYCETCNYEVTIIHIKYTDCQGRCVNYEYEGSFAELIRELTD